MSLMENIENNIKNRNKKGLKHLLAMYGVRVDILKLVESKETSVYGRDATTNYGDPIPAVGIVVNDDFFPADSIYSGTFKSGFFYTESKDLEPGDIIKISRQDGKIRKFKVKELQSMGTTTEVFKRFEISSTG